MAEKRQGAWFGFGFCGFGQALGSGNGQHAVHSPEPLHAADDVCQVSASWSYTALVTRMDSWVTGRSLEAELEPRLLEALQGLRMAEVAAGGWHSVCVSETGDIYIWGWNESGQLALPTRSGTEKKTVREEGEVTLQDVLPGLLLCAGH